MVAVDICNLALSYLGDSATVASIDPPEGSAQAQHCARFYPMALNLLLEIHQWNFITKRVVLSEVQADYGEWAFAYAVPSDFADVISVLPQYVYDSFDGYPAGYIPPTNGTGWFNYWRPFPFEIDCLRNYELEMTPSGTQVILSNVEDAILRYTCSTVQPGIFPALFSDALAWKLASMLAGPLLKGDVGAAESKRCIAMSQSVLQQAIGQDANDRHGSYRPPAPWMTARA